MEGIRDGGMEEMIGSEKRETRIADSCRGGIQWQEGMDWRLLRTHITILAFEEGVRKTSKLKETTNENKINIH